MALMHDGSAWFVARWLTVKLAEVEAGERLRHLCSDGRWTSRATARPRASWGSWQWKGTLVLRQWVANSCYGTAEPIEFEWRHLTCPSASCAHDVHASIF